MIRRKNKVSAEKAANADAAMDSLARLLTTRDRSVKEVHSRLREKGYLESTAAEAVERALNCGLLDDDRFAQRFIKDKHGAGLGKQRIEQELYRFGIRSEHIEGYPEAFFSEEDQLACALRALGKHRSTSKNPRQAAFRYLVNKGYSPDIATAAIRAKGSTD